MSRNRTTSWMAAFLVLFAVTLVGYSPAAATSQEKSAEPAAWKFHDIVDVGFVQPYVKMPKPEGVMIIDSRPYKPKFVNGYIPTAVSIPHSQFDKKKALLPEDKSTLLIFYCQGPT